jgi:hypothetical protein
MMCGVETSVSRHPRLPHRQSSPFASTCTWPSQHVPPILPSFTFHEGRHSHRTWLADDGIPEIGRAARLGQKMRGMGGIYGHVTPETKKRILDVLQVRWESSLLALQTQEQERLIALLPQMAETITQLRAVQQAAADQGAKIRAQLTPKQA